MSPSCHELSNWLCLLFNSLNLHYWISYICSYFACYGSRFHHLKVCRWYRTSSFPFSVISDAVLSRETGQCQHFEELKIIKLVILSFLALLCRAEVSEFRMGRCIYYSLLPPSPLWTYFNCPLCMGIHFPHIILVWVLSENFSHSNFQ